MKKTRRMSFPHLETLRVTMTLYVDTSTHYYIFYSLLCPDKFWVGGMRFLWFEQQVVGQREIW